MKLGASVQEFVVTRDLAKDDYPWLPGNIEAGDVVYGFDGITYGAISPEGIAVTFEDPTSHPHFNPFFEVPRDAVHPVGGIGGG